MYTVSICNMNFDRIQFLLDGSVGSSTEARGYYTEVGGDYAETLSTVTSAESHLARSQAGYFHAVYYACSLMHRQRKKQGLSRLV